MKKIILFFIVILCAGQSWAFTDCARPVENVWHIEAVVWVTFSDGGGAIYKCYPYAQCAGLANASTRFVDRLFDQASSSQERLVDLIVRYPEDGAACPPLPGPRFDFLGTSTQAN